MPNKHFNHFPTCGIRKKVLLSHNCLVIILLLLFCSAGAEAKAMNVAEYNLTIAFDLEKQLLKGTAIIAIPAGQGMSIHLNTLDVTALGVNGQAFDLNELDKHSAFSVESQNTPQKISIHYQQSFYGSKNNLISQAGITLLNDWYPQPQSACFFSLQAVIPDNFEAVSEADAMLISDCGVGKKSVECTNVTPLESLHFIAGPYLVKERSFGKDNSKKLYAYFFNEDAELADGYLQKAHDYLQRYEELIGPYPYSRFSIVENRLPTGFAMPTFTLLGQAVVRLPFIVDTSLGHEVLHSWFGNGVKVDYSQGNWCEGLTTFLADHAFSVEKGKGREFRKGQLVKYISYINSDTVIAMKDFTGSDLSHTPVQLAERAVGYGKVSMFFQMLSKRLGQEVFIASLVDFYQRMNGKKAGWPDILESFNTVSGQDLSIFFDQWLNRKDVAGLSANDVEVLERSGNLTLSFTLQQHSEKPYLLEVPLLIQTELGEVRKTILTDSLEKKVEILLDDYPVSFTLDQDYDLMRALDVGEMPPVWSWFNGASKKLAVVNSSSEYDIYAPLIDLLERLGAEIIAASEVTDEQLISNAIVFLGTKGPVSRSLFGFADHAEQGLTVDVRKNPLNVGLPVVLVTSSALEETYRGLAKLRHYGKYSFLHFEKGRALEKRIDQATMGIHYELDHEPRGLAITKSESFTNIIKELAAKRVVYVGEAHTRYEDHKLQLRVIRGMHRLHPEMAIGMEMFPSAAQQSLDDFVAGKIDEAQFLKESNYFKVWNYDFRLYRDILNFARLNKIRVIGLNIEKEKVAKVFKEGGVSSLSPEEMMTLPVDRDLSLPGYRDRLNSVFKFHPGDNSVAQFAGFFQAQAIWDETMAQNIVSYLDKHPTAKMVVLAGIGHVIRNNAIPPRVNKRLAVEQAVVVSSDGSDIHPEQIDYVVFMAKDELPPKVLMGIVMTVDKDSKEIIIEKVAEKSAAEKSGIKAEDVLLSMDEKLVKSIYDVKAIMLSKKKGDSVAVKVRRVVSGFFSDEKEIIFDLKL